MNKLNKSDLKKLENYSNKQLDVLRKSVNNLEPFAYSFVTVKELKCIDKVLSKISNALELEVKEQELQIEKVEEE